jgi:hypothetical protein
VFSNQPSVLAAYFRFCPGQNYGKRRLKDLEKGAGNIRLLQACNAPPWQWRQTVSAALSDRGFLRGSDIAVKRTDNGFSTPENDPCKTFNGIISVSSLSFWGSRCHGHAG